MSVLLLMHWSKTLARFATVFVLLLFTTDSSEGLARSVDGGMVGGTSYEGAPFAYRASPPTSELGTGSRDRSDSAARAANFGLLALISLVAALRWSRASRPSEPAKPMRLPLGAEPLPPGATTRNNPRLRSMAIQSGVALGLCIVGAFLPVALLCGLLPGWWYGGRLCSGYEMLGRSPSWMAIAAWKIGPAMVVASALAAAGVFLRWGIG